MFCSYARHTPKGGNAQGVGKAERGWDGQWPFTRVQYSVVFSCSVLTTLCSFFIQLPLIQLPLLYHINIYHRKSGVQPLEILKLDEESRLKKKLSCLKRTPSQPVLFLKIIFCYTLHFAHPLAESAGFCSPAESHAGSLCPTGKDFSRRRAPQAFDLFKL